MCKKFCKECAVWQLSCEDCDSPDVSESLFSELSDTDLTLIAVSFIIMIIGWITSHNGFLHVIGFAGFFYFSGRYFKGFNS